MKRRSFLIGSLGTLVAFIGTGATIYGALPVIPKRPMPGTDDALGWIAHQEGRFLLTLPRIEMGQNIATALKQIACTELEVAWDKVDVAFHDSDLARVRSTVGSESIMLFAEPLAQACASLRDALRRGVRQGLVSAEPRAKEQLKTFARHGKIGRTAEIVQGREIVTGKALYASDIRRPGMLFGRVLRAPALAEYASKPLSWNAEAARAIPGFVAIVKDCGPDIGNAKGLGIIAERPGVLDRVVEVLNVVWQTEEPTTEFSSDAPVDVDRRPLEEMPSNVVLNGRPEPGPWNVDLKLSIPFAAHGAIEPRAAVAEWMHGKLTVWAGTQDVFFIRDCLADAFSVAVEAVRVQSCRVGGSFGGKTICTVEAEAATLSRAAGAPVKVQWTRAQELASAFHRPPSSHRVRARIADGQVSDWDHRQVSSHILFTSAVVPNLMQQATDAFIGDGGVARGMAVPYVFPRARAAYDLVRLPVHTGPWRGLGAGPNGLVIESAIDEAALAAGADPLAFRLAHINDSRLAAVVEAVGEMSAWETWKRPENEIKVGRGIACGIYKEVSYAAVVAEVEVAPDGRTRVREFWCAHDCGLVINPDQVKAQCEGNLMWSVGFVLHDHLPMERSRIVAETFVDAPIPRMEDTPRMNVELIESAKPPAGAGETVMACGPGAIANAIRAATGIRPTRFPVRTA
ncbi:xanthine dehydrogenase family protein molybdopterin-binding subunit [Pararhizobium antarcticum]|uniref:Isoquinoline 1-oxidoreductase n=1 Tax=Pararhizobium antarcticum TaxID=1798805 RepID=A0A657LJM9_9HYPH|nr:molybdopterin cofactor-binding domain-containing protein [Pararhizobium antarcticum]OJF89649.1 Isoquinoline 1-oxidoreductase [Pararhizobium antarcticum]